MSSSISITPNFGGFSGKTSGEWRSHSAFAALRSDGAVFTWGDTRFGGQNYDVSKALDGTVDVMQIHSSVYAFAAVRVDGSVVTWGDARFGGDRSLVADQLDDRVAVSRVYSTAYAFAALREDGSVVTWGDAGGDSSAVAGAINGATAVSGMTSTKYAFAALREDGSVVTWGDSRYGGDSSGVAGMLDGGTAVTRVYATETAFAALREDGSVVTWGLSTAGGEQGISASALDGTLAVTAIRANRYAFAALREDGSVVTWGDPGNGGNSHAVAQQLDGRVAVTNLASNAHAFAARREDGSVVTWGSASHGGDSSSVSAALNGDLDVVSIVATDTAFAALHSDGSVTTWGDAGGDSSSVAAALDGSLDVVAIHANQQAFAALRSDGSVITWGAQASGGDSSAVAGLLDGQVDVSRVFASANAFSALRVDGSVVSWGDSANGGDNSVAANELHDVVYLADPTTHDLYINIQFTNPSDPSVSENTRSVITVNAVNPNNQATSYSISGGADAALFHIDPDSGELGFRLAPNHEVARDHDSDNRYQVAVSATSAGNSTQQLLNIQVNNQLEVPDLAPLVTRAEGHALVKQLGGQAGFGEQSLASGSSGVSEQIDLVPVFSTGLTIDGVTYTSVFLNDTGSLSFASAQAGVTDLAGVTGTPLIAGLLAAVDTTSGAAGADGQGQSSGSNRVYWDLDPSLGIATFTWDDVSDGSASSAFQIRLHDTGNGNALVEFRYEDVNWPGNGAAQAGWTLGDGKHLGTLTTGPAAALTEDSNSAHAGVYLVRLQDGSFSTLNRLAVDEGGSGQVSADLLQMRNPDQQSTAVVYQLTVAPQHGELRRDGSLLSEGDSFSQAEIDSGRISYLHHGGEAALDAFDFIASGPGGSQAGRFEMQILPINDAPVFRSPSEVHLRADREDSVTLIVDDPDNDPLQFSISGGVDAAQFQLGATSGVLSFVSQPPYASGGDNHYQVQVKVDDGQGGNAYQALDIHIDPGNSAPLINSPSVRSVYENNDLVGAIEASDINADPLHYAIAGGLDAALFRLDPDTGVLTFIDPPDFENPVDSNRENKYRLNITVEDGQGGSASQALLVQVLDGNDLPVFQGSESVEVAEGQVAVTQLAATDQDGHTIAYSTSGGEDAALFGIDSQSGQLRFLAPPDYEQPGDLDGNNLYLVEVTANDGQADTTRLIDVSVVNVNETPSFSSGSTVQVAENLSQVLQLQASDPDGDALQFSIIGGVDAALFAVDAATGLLSLLSPPDFENPADLDQDNRYQLQLRTSDGNGGSDDLELTVQVVDGNELPRFTSPANLHSDENQAEVAQLKAIDPEASPLTFHIVGGADQALFSIDPASGRLAFLEAPDFEQPSDSDANGIYQLQVEVRDALGGSASQLIGVEVDDLNDAPQLSGPSIIEMVEGNTTVARYSAEDQDGDSLTFSLGGADAALFSINPQTGELRFAAAPDFSAPQDQDADNRYQLQVSVADGHGGNHTQVLTVEVLDANHAPELTGQAGLSVSENNIAVTRLAATDSDGDTLVFSLVGGADQSLFRVDAASGQLEFASAPDFENPGDANQDNRYQVAVGVDDGRGGTDQQDLTVEVTDRNDLPEWLTSGPFQVDEGNTQVTTLDTRDDDGDTLLYSLAGGADQGQFQLDSNSGVLRFISAPDYEQPRDGGSDNGYQLEVRVDDGQGGIVVESLTVQVGNLNELPTITSASILSANEQQDLVGRITATDPDGDSLAFSIGGGADGGLFSLNSNTGELRFLTTPDYEVPHDADADGLYQVTVQVSDGNGGADQQAVQVSINDLNEAPEFISGRSVSVPEGTLPVMQVAAADLNGDSLAYHISGGADARHFTIDPATGELDFARLPNFEHPVDSNADNDYIVRVAVDDGNGGTAEQNIKVTVTNVAEPPHPWPSIPITPGNALVNGLGGSAGFGENRLARNDDDSSNAIDITPVFENGILLNGVNYDRIYLNNNGNITFEQAQANYTPFAITGETSNPMFATLFADVDTRGGRLTPTPGGNSTGSNRVYWDLDPDGNILTLTWDDVGYYDTETDKANAFQMRLFDIGNGDVVITYRYEAVNWTTGSASGGRDGLGGVAARIGWTSGDGQQYQELSLSGEQHAILDLENRSNINQPGVYLFAVRNGAPQWLGTLNLDEGARRVITRDVLAVDDPEDPNAAPRYEITSLPLNGRLLLDTDRLEIGDSFTQDDIDAGRVSYRHNGGETRLDGFDFTVSGVGGDFNSYFQFTINPVNDPPLITSGNTAAVDEGTRTVSRVLAEDAEGDPLRFAISGGPDQALFEIDPVSGQLGFRSAPVFDRNANNSYQLQVMVDDGNGGTATQDLQIEVNYVNQAPVLNGPYQIHLVEDGKSTLVADLQASDQDGDPLNFSLSGGADVGLFRLNANSGTLRFLQPPRADNPLDSNADNSYELRVSVDDGRGGSVSANYMVVVEAFVDDYGQAVGDTPAPGSILAGAGSTGNIEVPGDRDWFAASLQARHRYVIDLEGADSGRGTLGDPQLYGIYDAVGQLLPGSANADGGSGNNSRLQWTAGASATHYIAAAGFASSTGSYRLSLTDLGIADDYSADVATLGKVTIDGNGSLGEIEQAYDRDWFRVDGLLAGKTYRVRINGESANNIAALGDPLLQGIYAADGSLVPDTRNDDANNSRNALLDFRPNSDGSYFVSAAGYLNHVGVYRVTVEDLGYVDDYAADPSTTGRVGIGSSNGSGGTIEQAHDHDWFAVELLAGHQYRFDLQTGSSGGGFGALSDPYLSGLHDAAGNAIPNTSDDDSGPGSNASLLHTIDSSGTYYVAAAAHGDATGNYAVKVTDLGVPDDYAQAPWVISPDGTIDADALQPGEVSVGGASSGRIEIGGDRDWFAVELLADHDYRIELQGVSSNAGTLADPILHGVRRFHPANGGTLLLPRSSDDDSGDGLDALVDLSIKKSGTHFVSVGAYSGHTGSYRLSVLDLGVSDDYGITPDTAGQAEVGSPAYGHIEKAGDRDWFAVSLQAGHHYRVDLEGTPTGGGSLADTRINGIHDANGQLVPHTTSDDGGTGENARVDFTPDSSGIYHVSAGGFGGFSGTYTLNISDLGSLDDYAADTGTSGRVPVDGSSQGTIEIAGDRDWFAVDLLADHSYRIDLGGSPSLGGTLADTYLHGLHDSAGKLLAGTSNDDSNTSTDSQLQFTASSTGRYYIAAGGARDGIGTYKVSVADLGVLPNDDYGQTSGTAGQLRIDDSTTANIEQAGDRDWFAVELVAGRTYHVNIEGSASGAGSLLDPELLGIRAADGSLISGTANDDGGSGSNAFLAFTAAATGTHYLDAAASGSLTGSYKVSILDVTSAEDNDDYGEQPAKAGRVVAGGSASGRIEQANDQDWFALDLQQGYSYTIDLGGADSGGGSLADPYLRGIYDPSGVLLDGSSNDDTGGTLDSRVRIKAPTTGTYHVSAGAYGSTTGDYTLSVSAPQAGGDYDIQINFSGDTRYLPVFEAAAARWEEIIVGDVADIVSSRYGRIDDLVIDASVRSIDGPGRILAQAGPDEIRTSNSLPTHGVMYFDSSDMAGMVSKDILEEVVTHEMGHVIGFSGWMFERLGLSSGYAYTGSNGLDAYRTLASDNGLTSVPLETSGGQGTAGSHWMETVFETELMTGYAENNPPMPISSVTIGAFADIGYTVNSAAADNYQLPGSPPSKTAISSEALFAGLSSALAPNSYNGAVFDHQGNKPLQLDKASLASKLGGQIQSLQTGRVDGRDVYTLATFIDNASGQTIELSGAFEKNVPTQATELKGSVTRVAIRNGMQQLQQVLDYAVPRDIRADRVLENWYTGFLDQANWISVGAGLQQDDRVSGAAGDDSLYLGKGNDLLRGNSGKDRLSGQAGKDRLFGGIGNDTLLGGIGNDLLDGGRGNDLLRGGGGSDHYRVNTRGDRLIEPSKNGIDLVESSVDWTLGSNFEDLVLSGSKAIDGFGNAKANKLRGNRAGNVLRGKGGNDSLLGGPGSDTLTGGTGADTFHYANRQQGGDTIRDFKRPQGDQLSFARKAFGGLGQGQLAAKRFVANASGATSNGDQYFVFNTSNQTLYFDPDGSGKRTATAIARFTGLQKTLSNIDIMMT